MGRIREKRRHDDIGRVVFNRLYAGIFLIVAERIRLIVGGTFKGIAAMGVVGTVVKEEWSFVVGVYEIGAVFGHLDTMACPAGYRDIEFISVFRGDVIFADPRCSVSVLIHQYRQGLDIVGGTETMIAVLQAILAGGVIVEAGEDNRAARAAACGGAESVCKTRSFGGEGIQIGRSDNFVAVTAQSVAAVVVADNQDNVRSCDIRAHRPAGISFGAQDAGCACRHGFYKIASIHFISR